MGNFAIREISLSSSFLSSDLQRKQLILVISSTARKARAMAADIVDGSFKEQYKRIYNYAHELLKCNPGSTIKIKVENDNQSRK